MEGDRQIITELNGDDVTKCVIVEGVNDDPDRARPEWPWLFLGHLIANVKFRCGHRPSSEPFKSRPNRYINICSSPRLQKYRDNCPGTAPSQRAGNKSIAASNGEVGEAQALWLALDAASREARAAR